MIRAKRSLKRQIIATVVYFQITVAEKKIMSDENSYVVG